MIMKKCRRDKHDRCLHLILFVAICYILIVVLTPHFRVEVLNIDGLSSKIGNVGFQFAIAFVSAYIFWQVTVRSKEKRIRAKYSWWIHDQLNQITNLGRNILDSVGYDKKFSQDDVRNVLLNGKEAEDNRITMKAKVSKLESQISVALGINAPWKEVEIAAMGNIHNTCHELVDIATATLVEDNILPMYTLLTQLEKGLSEMDRISSCSIDSNSLSYD